MTQLTQNEFANFLNTVTPTQHISYLEKSLDDENLMEATVVSKIVSPNINFYAEMSFSYQVGNPQDAELIDNPHVHEKEVQINDLIVLDKDGDILDLKDLESHAESALWDRCETLAEKLLIDGE